MEVRGGVFRFWKKSATHGLSPQLTDIDQFSEWVARVLIRTSRALKPRRPLCFVKTDVKYRRTLLPVGFRIAEWTERLALPVQAHWIWQRFPHHSPYPPPLRNIFVFDRAYLVPFRPPTSFL